MQQYDGGGLLSLRWNISCQTRFAKSIKWSMKVIHFGKICLPDIKKFLLIFEVLSFISCLKKGGQVQVKRFCSKNYLNAGMNKCSTWNTEIIERYCGTVVIILNCSQGTIPSSVLQNWHSYTKLTQLNTSYTVTQN